MAVTYALRLKDKNELLGFSVASNGDADNADSVSYSLSLYEGNVWEADSAEHAEWVRWNSTKWYNASHGTPINGFNPDTLEVVEIVKTVKPVEVSLPSFKEVMLKMDELHGENSHAYFVDNEDYEQVYTVYQLHQYVEDMKNNRTK